MFLPSLGTAKTINAMESKSSVEKYNRDPFDRPRLHTIIITNSHNTPVLPLGHFTLVDYNIYTHIGLALQHSAG